MSIDMKALSRACRVYVGAEADLRRTLGMPNVGTAFRVDEAALREIARETGGSIRRNAYRSCYTECVDAFGVLFFADGRFLGEPKEAL